LADGNGRTARLVNNLHLIKSGFPPVIIDAVKDKPQYFDVLKKAQIEGEPGKGDPTRFILFMMGMEEHALRHYIDVLESTTPK
jgi:Fic family protein